MEVRSTRAMEGVTLDGPKTVLIVDDSEETREVLQTALQRRGMRTFSASRVKPGLELARRCCPDLIVLDLELADADLQDPAGPFARRSGAHATPLVMLGSIRRPREGLPEGEFVAKPYHYGPLIRKIEQLLGEKPQTLARSA